MRSATVLGAPIQTGTVISYSIRGDARLGSTLRPAWLQTDPDYPKSSHKSVVRSVLAPTQNKAHEDRIRNPSLGAVKLTLETRIGEGPDVHFVPRGRATEPREGPRADDSSARTLNRADDC